MSDVIEFDYQKVGECVGRYTTVKGRVVEKISQLEALIKKTPADWTGADAEAATRLLADANSRVALIDQNINACNVILENSGANFKTNEVKNATTMAQAYFG